MRDDSWLMGALAAQDAYRGDDPQWPEPPQPGAVFNSPWERGVAIAGDYTGRDTPPASATEEPPEMGSLLGMGRAGDTVKRAAQGVAKAADYYAGMPKRVYEGVRPETPGRPSEVDDWRAQKLADAAYEWAPSTAFGMVFDPFGAKRSVGAGGVALGSGAGGGKIIQPTEGIRAYHSSPYDFEKFDLSKIGTGEGAQVYGHGIYAAENPAVSGQGGQYWQQFLQRFGGDERRAAEYLRDVGFDRNRAMRLLDEGDPAVAGLIKSGQPVGPRTYEVAIHAKPEEFLDWDKGLHRQSPEVQKALETYGIRADPAGMKQYDDALLEALTTPSRNVRVPPQPHDPSGAQIYESSKLVPGSYRNKAAASNALQNAGIPGIRYLDQGSRMEVINPTSNYVVFDPAKIAILRKYGLAGAVPTMGALAAESEYRQ